MTISNDPKSEKLSEFLIETEFKDEIMREMIILRLETQPSENRLTSGFKLEKYNFLGLPGQNPQFSTFKSVVKQVLNDKN